MLLSLLNFQSSLAFLERTRKAKKTIATLFISLALLGCTDSMRENKREITGLGGYDLEENKIVHAHYDEKLDAIIEYGQFDMPEDDALSYNTKRAHDFLTIMGRDCPVPGYKKINL